jgi:hypothetical protein
VRIDPVKAEVVCQMFAWYTDLETPASLYWVAKQLSEHGIPTPRGGVRWNVATIRGILRSPAYAGRDTLHICTVPYLLGKVSRYQANDWRQFGDGLS